MTAALRKQNLGAVFIYCIARGRREKKRKNPPIDFQNDIYGLEINDLYGRYIYVVSQCC